MLEEKPQDVQGLVKVKISNLSLGEHQFEFSCKAKDFSDSLLTEENFPGSISVFLDIEKNATEILVTLQVEADAHFECDRCLAPVEKKIEGSYNLCFLMGEQTEHSLDKDGTYTIDKNTIEIDFSEDVRETLLLAIPMKNVCEDEDTCAERTAQNTSSVPTEPTAPEPEQDLQEESEWQKALKQLEKKINTNHK